MSKPENKDARSNGGLFGIRFLDRLIVLPLTIVMTLFLSLLLNIVIEWVGIGTEYWKQPGAEHALSMLRTELGWLNDDFKTMTTRPARLARSFAQKTHSTLFVWNDHDISQPYISSTYVPTTGWRAYVGAGVATIQLFAIRVAVMVLSFPMFLILGLVALVDGLMVRELRRWGGAEEKGFVYHRAKRFAPLMFWLPLVIYISLPISIHPSLIIVPFALLFALSLWVSILTFKQYL